jgi:hypothetical protein
MKGMRDEGGGMKESQVLFFLHPSALIPHPFVKPFPVGLRNDSMICGLSWEVRVFVD